jgi:hypothetical protein
MDALMGCGTEIFPLIGRVANLVRRVRRTDSNSPTIISQALELQSALKQWAAPAFVEQPQDSDLCVEHGRQTAEAYRYATLLYLHQAVPEIASSNSATLARQVLCRLATVPMSSGAVIVQIFPLTAAGCEAVTEEDRTWVRDRLQAMARRLSIGVMDRCADIVYEVWNRRDMYEAMRELNSPITDTAFDHLLPVLPLNEIMPEIDCDIHTKGVPDRLGERQDSFTKASEGVGVLQINNCRPNASWHCSYDPFTDDFDPEYTVRGMLHWLGVMRDWQWEVLLG